MNPAAARALCLDVGSRRVGVAVSDALGMTAQPLEMLDRRTLGDAKVVARIVSLIKTREVTTLVVGLPLTLSGQAGQAAQRTRRFMARLTPKLPDTCQVVEWDERMSTMAAERALIEGGVRSRARRERVDAVAAALILQGWMGSLDA